MRVTKKQIERIVIIGKQEEVKRAFDYCDRFGYRVVRSGPKPVTRHTYDTSKFKIIAQREIKKDE